jgi:KDO2-lipid IV(A) lauroyltransferase
MLWSIKGQIEYSLAWLLIKTFGALPRSPANHASRALGRIAFRLARRQRNAGLRNLRMVLPELSEAERERILRGCFDNLGRLLVEFTHFPQLNKGNISQFVIHDGLENYLEGVRRGRGGCAGSSTTAWSC